MRLDRTRVARRALLVLVVLVSALVGWSLLSNPDRPSTRPKAAGDAHATTLGAGGNTGYTEAKRDFDIKWRSLTVKDGASLLEGVEATLPFVSQGRQGLLTITSESATYTPEPRRASFKGHVRVVTDDGFELDTESLKYLSQPQDEVRSGDPVALKRGKLSGTAMRLLYRAGTGVDLMGEVKLRIEDPSGVPVEIEASAASAAREESVVWLEEPVLVRQGARELRAKRLRLDMSPDFHVIRQAAAFGDVDLQVGGEAPLPGTAAAPKGGSQRLRSGRLDVVFRAEGGMEVATAADDARLEILPGPGEVQERRLLQAPSLKFGFDEHGRLASLESAGEHAARGGTQRTLLVTEPPAAKGQPVSVRRVEADSLRAQLDPATGGLQRADFAGRVVFDEQGRRASAERAVVDEGTGVITLSGGDPMVADQAQGSELHGREIRIGSRSREVSARESVRHTITRRLGPVGAGEPTVILCREFDYDPVRRAARYRGDALLRSAQDEIRAPLIEIDEPAEGRRRLHARDGVVTLAHPRAKKPGAKPPAPIETRSREMTYEEAERRIVYLGDVEIRQADIRSKSPEATVLLAPDGATMDRVVAGPPVEVRRGAQQRADGRLATYTPRDETLVLVGEDVELRDGERRVKGRILTFQAGSDRIRVDGREEVRTEAVFKRREPPKP